MKKDLKKGRILVPFHKRKDGTIVYMWLTEHEIALFKALKRFEEALGE